MQPQDNKAKQTLMRQKQELDQLARLQDYQAAPQWEELKTLIYKAVYHSDSLGAYRHWPYGVGEDPVNTAVKNEMFNAYKLGMLATLSFVDEREASLQKDMGRLARFSRQELDAN